MYIDEIKKQMNSEISDYIRHYDDKIVSKKVGEFFF
ncbi:hypothetical protein Bandiella_00312 [Candidatus Bandiella woodruffii]|uniref:Uncharacterized protein n=1 Tax=Candidatus Bandiella euplotis TaxID=1664265 RepID=A0ABZ0UJD0_9RICK|nr:hypothetical protein Bandiella_00312 [Candidatus Bandiella woodruffii]